MSDRENAAPEGPARGPAFWATLVVVGLVLLVVLFTVVFPWVERSLSSPTIG